VDYAAAAACPSAAAAAAARRFSKLPYDALLPTIFLIYCYCFSVPKI
jgi:hypothetical protein